MKFFPNNLHNLSLNLANNHLGKYAGNMKWLAEGIK